jgi:ABC-type nitrate/sulfonate/bicarbonate transport system substrate-binding protein
VSSLDQPLLLATVNYHVGHTMSIRVAEERGFFREEGFSDYVFADRGMLPGPFERDALALSMDEHGVDVALGAGIAAALHQRAAGADLFIVAGWRLDGPAGTRWYGVPPFNAVGALRGAKVGVRELGALDQLSLAAAMTRSGLDPERDVEWVCDPIFYGDRPELVPALESRRVDLAPIRPRAWDEVERRGYAVVLDSASEYPGGRPGKVIVATGRTVRERAVELRAFLRANIRAFWFCRDVDNAAYLADLETRLRAHSHNDVERVARLSSNADCAAKPMPLDGGVDRGELARVMAELAAQGELPAGLAVDDVLGDAVARDAYRELGERSESAAALERNRRLIARFGY